MGDSDKTIKTIGPKDDSAELENDKNAQHARLHLRELHIVRISLYVERLLQMHRKYNGVATHIELFPAATQVLECT